jgi:hypothetical protein
MSLPFDDFQIRRCRRLLREYLNHFRLNLTGLSVFTEAASGWYMFTPAMCALAGATQVHALARDSQYGSTEEIIAQSRELMEILGCGDSVEFHAEKTAAALADADIVMNAGAVRPIDALTISQLKPTAVIPLMWETWEFRPNELDLDACRKRDILVMGTDEITLDRFPFAGYLPMKLLFQCNVEVFKSRLLLIGSGRSGRGMVEVFHKNGFDFRWICFDKSVPEHLARYRLNNTGRDAVLDWVRQVDAVVCFEHLHDRPVIHAHGVLDPEAMHAMNDSLVLVHVSGVVDFDTLEELGVRMHPGRRVPFGTMSVGTWEMGPRSIIELTMAGIKVGESMARSRLAGLSHADAARVALRNSLAQDFEGDKAWIKD